jgi:lysophospholipid acyltransferase
MEALNAAFAGLANQTGFPVDQLKYLSCLLLAVPLSSIFRFLGSGHENVKHLISIVISIFFCHFSLGEYSWIHSLMVSMISYTLLSLLPHGIAHKAVFVFALGHLSACHIYRMYEDWSGWSLDFTGPQMILTIKLTTLSVDYYDGNRTDDEKARMSSFQKEHMIGRLPTMLEFLGYVYFFPGFLAGPAILFSEYRAFVNGSMFKEFPGRIPPNPFLPSLRALGKAICVFPLVFLAGYVRPIDLALPFFAEAPVWEKVGRLYVHISSARMKYYFGWFLAEASCISSGFGYSGKDKKGNLKWDRAVNAYPVAVELAPNIRTITDNWNLGTATWLKHYIYLRFSDQRSMLPTLATYSCSAFWHGFYPGYYLFFISAAFLTETSKEVRRKIRPLFMKNETTPNYPIKYAYDIAGIIATSLIMNCVGVSFVILEWQPVYQIWSNLYFAGHIILFASWFVITFIVPARPRLASGAKEK